jgi:signal transduction histidine kinase
MTDAAGSLASTGPRQPERTPPPARQLLWLAGLATLASLADFFAPVVFASHSLVLGLVFYWIAIRVNGHLPALLVLAAGTATLWIKWGQPFSALLIALEGLFVGMAWRRGRNPLLADLGFWLLIGTPLSWFLYRQVLPIPHPSFEQALVVQPLNGLLAVWLAYLALDQLAAGGAGTFGRADRDFRGVLFRRYVAFGTLPVLAASLIAVRSFEGRALEEANASLRSAALNLAGEVGRSVEEASLIVQMTAARLREPGWRSDREALELTLDNSYARSALFTTMLAADARGRVIAGVPTALRRSVLGNSPTPPVTDREYFKVPMASGRAHVSGVFRGRSLGTDLLIAVGAPVINREGRAVGVIQGAILVSKLGELLGRGTAGTRTRYLLTDSRLQVIASEGFEEAPLAPLAGTSLARLISTARTQPSRVTADRDGARVSFLSTSVPLPALGWTLTLQREWSDVLRPVMGAYIWSLIVAVFTTLFASFFATWSLRDFLHAWRDLIAFSRAPEARAEALRNSARLDLPIEFSELIRNLVEMARRLEAEHLAREELLARLESKVEERTSQLEEALQRARTADRAKGAFLATVSHELRTPLTAVVTAVRLLRMMPATRPEAEARTLATLESSSRALMSVISDVLDYSQLEAGAVRIDTAPFQPTALAADVVSILAPEVQRSGVDLRTRQEHPAELVWPGDSKRVKQVLLNLAGNAVKFAPAGHVEIVSWTTNEPRQLWFAVTDNGPGLPPESLESVFEAFVQLETSPTQSKGGTGLGLSISRRLVELMGGKIRAADTGGRGARFEFWLPEVPPPRPPSNTPFPPAA